MPKAAHISTNSDQIPPGTRRISMASVFCHGCHAPHTLNERSLCEFCEIEKKRDEGQGARDE